MLQTSHSINTRDDILSNEIWYVNWGDGERVCRVRL